MCPHLAGGETEAPRERGLLAPGGTERKRWSDGKRSDGHLATQISIPAWGETLLLTFRSSSANGWPFSAMNSIANL